MWDRMNDYDKEDVLLDLDFLEQELNILKEANKVAYIDKRARENDLSDDLLEEVKTAFHEIANKEKTLKQVTQVLEFLLEHYTNLSENFKEATYRLKSAEDDNIHLRDNVIVGLNSKLDRHEKTITEMEQQLVKAESEVRDLKRQLSKKKPETAVISSMKELEQRVRRQSMIDTNGKISGLEEALNSYKSNSKDMESTIAKQSSKIDELKKEVTKLKKDLYTSYDNFDRLQRDTAQMTKMKSSLEAEFQVAVDTRDSQIDQLYKQLDCWKEEYEQVLRRNMELESKLAKLCSKSTDSPISKIVKNGDRVETQASNDDDPAKRFDEHIADAESDSDQEILFDNQENFTVTLRNRETSENLADLLMMGSRNSYHGDTGYEDEHDGFLRNLNRQNTDDLSRLVDRAIQTEKDGPKNFTIRLESIEEEKYNTGIQDDSVDIDLDVLRRANESYNNSTLLSPTKRKDALEEFFKMTVLATKIAHQDMDKVCHVKSSKLYEKAKYKKIQFQEWQPWIEQQLNQLYLETIYENKSKAKGLLRLSSHDSNREPGERLSPERRQTGKKKQSIKKLLSGSKNPNKSKGYLSLKDEDESTPKQKCTIF